MCVTVNTRCPTALADEIPADNYPPGEQPIVSPLPSSTDAGSTAPGEILNGPGYVPLRSIFVPTPIQPLNPAIGQKCPDTVSKSQSVNTTTSSTAAATNPGIPVQDTTRNAVPAGMIEPAVFSVKPEQAANLKSTKVSTFRVLEHRLMFAVAAAALLTVLLVVWTSRTIQRK